jgi:hypothetical protein
MLGRQALYCLSHTSSPGLTLPRLALNANPPPCTFKVSRITGKHHHAGFRVYFHKNYYLLDTNMNIFIGKLVGLGNML